MTTWSTERTLARRSVCAGALLLGLLAPLAASHAEAAGEPLLEVLLGQRRVLGMSLAWDREQAALLQRDGRILVFSPSEAQQVRRTEAAFRALTPTELRGPLLREFGARFDVQLAGRYVVVHPRGRDQRWARQFDSLHRSFLTYFAARGIRTSKPRFPLVAVVLPDRAAFQQYAAREGAALPANCAGYYSPRTNRVVQYDHGRQGNGPLIIHEASHQVAFNVGVHHRGSPPPRWLCEGLGTMFERPGVWNSAAHPDRKDRIHQPLLKAFRDNLPSRPQNSLASFVASDRPFRTNTEAAYSQAWALSFYLSEARPREWADYLRLTSSTKRPPLVSASGRLDEFTQAFGEDLQLLESHFLRFISQLD